MTGITSEPSLFQLAHSTQWD